MHYKTIKYPDGSSYIIVNEFVKEFTFKINSYEDLWKLNQIRDVYKHNGKNAIVTIPSLFEAQADRRFNDKESAGLKLLCNFLNSMGWEQIKIFHPHNPEVVEALIPNAKIIDNSGFIKEVLGTLYTASNFDGYRSMILMSTDAGGFKPLMKLCDKLYWQGETFSASKSRSYIDGKSKLTQLIDKEDFEGKDILIIDDICVYGGTFKGLVKLLKERNCGKLYLAVSHMTVQDLGDDPVTNYFDEVITTNSKYDTYFSNGKLINNLKIINMF